MNWITSFITLNRDHGKPWFWAIIARGRTGNYHHVPIVMSSWLKTDTRPPFHKGMRLIVRTIGINRSSMADCVKLAINRNPFWNGAQYFHESLKNRSALQQYTLKMLGKFSWVIVGWFKKKNHHNSGQLLPNWAFKWFNQYWAIIFT